MQQAEFKPFFDSVSHNFCSKKKLKSAPSHLSIHMSYISLDAHYFNVEHKILVLTKIARFAHINKHPTPYIDTFVSILNDHK